MTHRFLPMGRRVNWNHRPSLRSLNALRDHRERNHARAVIAEAERQRREAEAREAAEPMRCDWCGDPLPLGSKSNYCPWPSTCAAEAEVDSDD